MHHGRVLLASLEQTITEFGIGNDFVFQRTTEEFPEAGARRPLALVGIQFAVGAYVPLVLERKDTNQCPLIGIMESADIVTDQLGNLISVICLSVFRSKRKALEHNVLAMEGDPTAGFYDFIVVDIASFIAE